jgi:dephospho-CoA kinase
MLLVGLTGGIASGKTTVSRMFQDAGIPVICADELARDAVQPGSPALEEICRIFGAQVIDEEGGLDRSLMAELVFKDQAKREVLESIIHPMVAEEKDRRIQALRTGGYRLAIVDVPLLYEKKWERQFDLVVVVYVPRTTQEERLAQRDGMSPDEARARLDAQMPIEEKKQRADRVVDNSDSLEHTREQVNALLRELQFLASPGAPSSGSCEPSVRAP